MTLALFVPGGGGKFAPSLSCFNIAPKLKQSFALMHPDFDSKFRAGQVRKLVRKSAIADSRKKLRTCGLADFSSLNCGLAVADYF